MSKCPRVVKLGYHDVQITLTEVMPGDAHGYAQTEPARITVDSSLPPKDEANTVLHELLHIMYSQYGLDDKSDEERVVTTLANGLTELWHRNPRFAAYFAERTAQ